MRRIVLDSWALLAFFDDEPAAPEVERILQSAAEQRVHLLLSVVNWGEVYYITRREYSQAAAEQKAAEILNLPIELVPVDADLSLVRQAAIFKATRKMAYADCFAAALAKLQSAELLTGDPEFHEVEDELRLRWLPRS